MWFYKWLFSLTLSGLLTFTWLTTGSIMSCGFSGVIRASSTKSTFSALSEICLFYTKMKEVNFKDFIKSTPVRWDAQWCFVHGPQYGKWATSWVFPSEVEFENRHEFLALKRWTHSCEIDVLLSIHEGFSILLQNSGSASRFNVNPA